MKIRSALALLLVLPASTPLRLLADDAAPAAPAAAPAVAAAPATAPAAAPSDEKKTELEMRMGRVGKAFRKLRKQVADPAQNASSLELVGKIQAAFKESEALTPEKADDVPADQRAKFVSDYQAGIKAMEDQFTKLSDALTAGKNTDATAIVGDIFEQMKKDHKEFRRPEKS